MRIKRSFQATALMSAAAVLGLLATQGTYALWSATAHADAGTIQAASFDVQMSDGTTQKLMTGADGQPAALLATTSTRGVLAPGVPLYAGIALTNQSNASADFTVRVTGGLPSITGSTGLATNVSIASATADSLGGCAGASYTAGTKVIDVPKLQTGVLCYRATLLTGATAELNGSSASVRVPITAEQL